VVESILRQIAVRDDVLNEAKKRRRLICRLAMQHEAARRWYYSGSIAHGTHNAPLGDADCGVVLNRMFERFRAFLEVARDGAVDRRQARVGRFGRRRS